MSKQLKNYDYILSLDPSGSYNEGKGHTGWVIINKKNAILELGLLTAVTYDTKQKYWQAHIDLINYFNKNYPNSVVVFEDYLLYATKAKQQINSKMETPQLLGILKYHLNQINKPFKTQMAAEVKKRWDEPILVWKNILIKKDNNYYIETGDNHLLKINNHIRDALKHAIHYNTFYNYK